MNSEVALTYVHWKVTLKIMQESANHNAATLAGIVYDLIEINKHDPATIAYLNKKAHEYLEVASK